tara:strand:- start:643 stop:1368 length:726 start_codon:yes stop_codon:yes gene_type:complete
MPETMNDYLSPAGARARLAQNVFTSDRAFNKMQTELYDYNVSKAQSVGKYGTVGAGGGWLLSKLLQKFVLPALGPWGKVLDLGLTATGAYGGSKYGKDQWDVKAPEIRRSDIKFGDTSLTETETLQKEQEKQYTNTSQLWNSLGIGLKALMFESMIGGKGGLFGTGKAPTGLTLDEMELYHDFGIESTNTLGSALSGKTIADLTVGLLSASPWFLSSYQDTYEEEEEDREGKSEYASPSYV